MPDIECIVLKGTERRLLNHVGGDTTSGPSAAFTDMKPVNLSFNGEGAKKITF